MLRRDIFALHSYSLAIGLWSPRTFSYPCWLQTHEGHPFSAEKDFSLVVLMLLEKSPLLAPDSRENVFLAVPFSL